jgi:hypothetical protein
MRPSLNLAFFTLPAALALCCCSGNLADGGDGGGGGNASGASRTGSGQPDDSGVATPTPSATPICDGGSSGDPPVPSGAACATTPTAQATLLAPSAGGLPWGLAVDATQVFWGIQEGGPAMHVSLAGGSATPLGTTSAWTLAIDATDVYTADGAGNIVSCPKSGCAGSPRIIATNATSTMGIAVDATSVYWATLGGATVQSAPKTGGGPTTTLATGGYPYEIALDDTYVYWTDNNGPVWKVAKTGGAPVKLADQTALNSFQPMGIAVDGANVYFDTSDGKIWQVSKACGGAPILLASDAGNEPWGIAVDDQAVYYASGTTGAVESVPIGGGCVTRLASQPSDNGCIGVAVDATSVYFTGTAGVYKVSK